MKSGTGPIHAHNSVCVAEEYPDMGKMFVDAVLLTGVCCVLAHQGRRMCTSLGEMYPV